MFAVRMNLLVSFVVLGSRTTKTLLVVADGGADHLAGIDKNSSSNEPISTTGHSTSPETSSSRPWSSTSSKPCVERELLGVG